MKQRCPGPPQKDLASGEPCFLGTIVVMPLKLMVPDVDVEARGGSASVGGIARVHLIGTRHIPSGNAAVVTAEVRGLVKTGLPCVLIKWVVKFCLSSFVKYLLALILKFSPQ